MTATKTRAAARLSVQVQQVWIGRKSGFGSGVPWRYSDRNPFGLTAVKYPPLLLVNVHRFQMRLHPSDRPLHTTPLLDRSAHMNTVSQCACSFNGAEDRASLTCMQSSCTPRTTQSPISGPLRVSINIIVTGDRWQAAESRPHVPASRPCTCMTSGSPH